MFLSENINAFIWVLKQTENILQFLRRKHDLAHPLPER